jgi:hypothetical protein
MKVGRTMDATLTTLIEKRLRELELELLQPVVRHNPHRLSSLLADDFREFGSSCRVFLKNEIIEALRDEPLMQWSISDFHAELLGDSVALVTYQAVRREEASSSGTASLRSSLWVIRGGQWQMLFRQGTRVTER